MISVLSFSEGYYKIEVLNIPAPCPAPLASLCCKGRYFFYISQGLNHFQEGYKIKLWNVTGPLFHITKLGFLKFDKYKIIFKSVKRQSSECCSTATCKWQMSESSRSFCDNPSEGFTQNSLGIFTKILHIFRRNFWKNLPSTFTGTFMKIPLGLFTKVHGFLWKPLWGTPIFSSPSICN